MPPLSVSALRSSLSLALPRSPLYHTLYNTRSPSHTTPPSHSPALALPYLHLARKCRVAFFLHPQGGRWGGAGGLGAPGGRAVVCPVSLLDLFTFVLSQCFVCKHPNGTNFADGSNFFLLLSTNWRTSVGASRGSRQAGA